MIIGLETPFLVFLRVVAYDRFYGTILCNVYMPVFFKFLFLGQKMDDLSRIPGNHCPKVFVHRDYTNGTSLCFQSKFPPELEGKVLS